jgi:hypothetical protein
MTNPGWISELQLPGDTAPKDVTAVAYVPPAKAVPTGLFWFGTMAGTISVAREPPGQSVNLTFEARFSSPVRHHKVRTLAPVSSPPGMLAHWVGLGDQAGPAEMIFPGGVRQPLDGKATEVAVATRGPGRRRVSHSSTTNPSAFSSSSGTTSATLRRIPRMRSSSRSPSRVTPLFTARTKSTRYTILRRRRRFL